MFNSFANWYLHKKAFIAIYSEEDWKVVETTFTGDDSVFSVPEKYEKYNMQYLSEFFKETEAMVYTSPTKTSEMTVEWEDLQYLKRKFVLGHAGIMAPLAERSIANMVKWTDTNQDLVVMTSVVNSVLLEAWHYGEEFYNKCLEWVKREERRLEVIFRVPDWKGMKTLREPDY
jgi:GTPase SAR1 family protein